jgi:Putative glucoamylase/Protein of unknown function (DUF3131)
MIRPRSLRLALLAAGTAVAAALALTASVLPAQQAGADGSFPVTPYHAFTGAERANLMSIAQQTWNFYNRDIDAATGLPMDNITFAGGSSTPTALGSYANPEDFAMYLWAVTSARDLRLISDGQAANRIRSVLTAVSHLANFNGLLYAWYDTTNGKILTNPGQPDCAPDVTPSTSTNCVFVPGEGNAWWASSLIIVREAFPQLAGLANKLLKPMNLGLFYDNGPETACNVNPATPGDQATGQQFFGYYVGVPQAQQPTGTNGAFYSDPRILAYIGMGLPAQPGSAPNGTDHQIPGNDWWKSWRILPPPSPAPGCASTDPDFSWTGGESRMTGSWQTFTDPQSGQQFGVWEAAYNYDGIKYVPTWAGGEFEALMPNLIVPETSWGTSSFGLADQRTVQLQIRYATHYLGYPVWGLSASSTADDTGNYNTYGVEGVGLPGTIASFPYHGTDPTASAPNLLLDQCGPCSTEDVVTPYASFIALDAAPQQAYANIQNLRSLYPGLYGADGFFDAVNPSTGSVGHRILDLDDSMIMAALDNALNNRALQRDFASDPVSWAAHTYLELEHMPLS